MRKAQPTIWRRLDNGPWLQERTAVRLALVGVPAT
jgi:hypothetical protein